MFGQLLKSSESPERLLRQIANVSETWMRTQLNRVFRRYVSPNIPVEMLKRKTKIDEICEQFRDEFRPIQAVQKHFETRPIPGEALCVLLWKYKSRGQKGYALTERLFDLLNAHLPKLMVKGPKGAGQDIRLGEIFDDYPNPNRPIDFLLYDEDKTTILAVGLARYDGDRGGAQEDDRIGGYRNCANEILQYAEQTQQNVKVVFINDGPGLLLGSMWDDYAAIEQSWTGKILVATLRMVAERITYVWLKS